MSTKSHVRLCVIGAKEVGKSWLVESWAERADGPVRGVKPTHGAYHPTPGVNEVSLTHQNTTYRIWDCAAQWQGGEDLLDLFYICSDGAIIVTDNTQGAFRKTKGYAKAFSRACPDGRVLVVPISADPPKKNPSAWFETPADVPINILQKF
jgi:GTPase SAR1 family protein